MKKRAKPVGKKAARKPAAKKPTAKSGAAPKRKPPAQKPAPSRPAATSRGTAPADRAAVEAARYTPGPVQSTGWPPFRYPPQ